MSSEAAARFIDKLADDPGLQQRVEKAVAREIDRATMLAVARIGQAEGFDFTADELVAGPPIDEALPRIDTELLAGVVAIPQPVQLNS